MQYLHGGAAVLGRRGAVTHAILRQLAVCTVNTPAGLVLRGVDAGHGSLSGLRFEEIGAV